MAKTTIEKAIAFKNWETSVSDMMNISKNPNYIYTNPKNKYYYFTDHMKGWIQGLFGLVDDGEDLVKMDEGELDKDQKSMAYWMDNFTHMNKNWWEVALKGEKHPDYYPLPTIEGKIKAEELAQLKDDVYDQLLPAYRALEESHSKRWWFEWIFNHRQYTAERDALKVMTNMILSMTNDSMEEFNERYQKFVVEVPTSNFSKISKLVEERKTIAKNMAENDKELEKINMFEKGQEEYEKKMQQIKEEEMEDAKNKAADKLTMKNQFTICTADGKFESQVKDDIKAVLSQANQNPATQKLIPIMLDAQFYKPMMKEVGALCDKFDQAIEEGTDKAEMGKIVNEGVNNIFKVALKATAFIRINDPQTRITLAQKVTDIVLNGASPVAFKQQEYGIYGKGNVVLQNEKVIRKEFAEQYAYDALTNAINGAKEIFGEMYPENKGNDIEPIKVELEESKMELVPPVDSNVLDSSSINMEP